MKFFSGKMPFSSPRRLVVDCVLLLLAHLGLLAWMAHSHVIEKIMAEQVNFAELLLILTFVVVRLLAYFLVPATLAAILVLGIFGRLVPEDRK